MMIIMTHIYLDYSRVLFPWKLCDVLRWMHEDWIVFAWELILLALVYKNIIDIQKR